MIRLAAPARRLAILAGLAVALTLAPLAVAAPADGARRLELVFDRLNGRYQDLAPELVPLDTGGVVLKLRSESNSVELTANRIVLTPRTGSVHQMVATAEIEASALLAAEMSVAGVGSGFEDQIEAPRQILRLTGAVRLERHEAGYLVTVVEAPEVLEVAIESRLAGRMVSGCRLVPWVGGCDALEGALSRLKLPLPKPGRRFLLDAGNLTAGERMQIDSYLQSTG